MRFAFFARWAIVALLALGMAGAVWRITRTEPAPAVTVTVSQGEVELRVSGPGTVHSRAAGTGATRT